MSDSTAGNNMNSTSPTVGDGDFSFKYTESGGLTARYLLISFDSKTTTDISSSNLSRKTISDSDKQQLKETIVKNNFFESKTDYPSGKKMIQV